MSAHIFQRLVHPVHDAHIVLCRSGPCNDFRELLVLERRLDLFTAQPIHMIAPISSTPYVRHDAHGDLHAAIAEPSLATHYHCRMAETCRCR